MAGELLDGAAVLERRHGLLPPPHPGRVAQGGVQPSLEPPGAHRRGGGVEHAVECAGAACAVEPSVDFQVAAGGRVQGDVLVHRRPLERVDVVQGLATRFPRIAQHRGRGLHRGRHPLDAEAGEVTGAEVVQQVTRPQVRVEVEGGAALDGLCEVDVRILGEHHLGGADAGQFGGEGGGRLAVADAELTGG